MIGRRPGSAGDDRRYWRRRSNRRVRKVRLARRLLRFTGIALLHAALLAMLLVAGNRALRMLSETPRLAVREIRIAGAERASAPALREELAWTVGQSLLRIDLERVERFVLRDPWVRAAAVERVLPATLRVEVTERVPAAVAVIDRLAHVVDAQGVVIGPSGPGLADDLPLLTGLDGLADDALAAALARGARSLERIRSTAQGFARGISELDLGRPDRARLRLVDSSLTLLLDPERVERNLRRYLDLQAEIEDRVGPARYVDLRWRNRISVMPAGRASGWEGS